MDRYKELRKKSEATKEAARLLGHVSRYIGAGYMSDQYVCSCGWESNKFFDGEEYAAGEWLKHAEKVVEAGQGNLNLG